ncbi:MAG: hypothetical protein KAS86_04185, partial [Candidatus Omnitrophica bacterium]|nr:hypothetical protein [Candidatus Omnitrophota bacterium]
MKEKKKVLIITYFYLPIRRSVSYRVRVWAECLSRLGWEPVILTRHWDKDTMDPFEQDFTPVTEGMDPEINCRV